MTRFFGALVDAVSDYLAAPSNPRLSFFQKVKEFYAYLSHRLRSPDL